MAVWDRNKVDSTQLNGGNEFDSNSQLALDEVNAVVNGGLYSQDFAEHLADAPDNTLANQVGTAEVEIVDNVVGGKTYKKFKFKNLKGEIGGSAPLETSSSAMQQNGIASIGNSGKLAQSNHIHPNDTTKVSVGDNIQLGTNANRKITITQEYTHGLDTPHYLVFTFYRDASTEA